MEGMSDHVQVIFSYHSPVLDEPVEEILSAKPVDGKAGTYELVSIPFYGLSLATQDRFEASMDPERDQLVFQNVVLNSGNSVVVVALLDQDAESEHIQQSLSELGCQSEQLNKTYFACAVPKGTFYGEVRTVLEGWEAEETIEFAETKLSAKHQADLRRRKK